MIQKQAKKQNHYISFTLIKVLKLYCKGRDINEQKQWSAMKTAHKMNANLSSNQMHFACIQDTLSSRAALGLRL